MDSSAKTAIVTGGGRGLGRGIVLGLAQKGWKVAINYRNDAASANVTLRLVEEAGGTGLLVKSDIASAKDREFLVDSVLQAGGRIDILVNNAGMAPHRRTDLLEMSEESYDAVLAVNLKGPFFLTQRVAREMIALIEAGKIAAPKIVNISSISASTSSLNRGEYCISKAGLGMAAALWATRLAASGVKVFEIRPGIIRTDMIAAVEKAYEEKIAAGLLPQRRMGEAHDVALAVRAIADGLLDYSTGQVLNVDGGFHLRSL
jgi:NAD(P)-dependent dehydrogenase (short-subunit alcohol dehydrogenase family)